MAFVVLMMLVLVLSVALTAWSALTDGAAGDKAGPAKNAGQAHEVAKPATLEGALVRQLIDAEISKVQYRHAMWQLAERDADRHPLTVPPVN